MTRKEFRSAAQEANGDALEVDLGDGDIFSVTLPLPGLAILDIAAAASQEGAGSVSAMREFLEAVMGSDVYAKFHATAMTKRLSIESIGEIMQWIVEEATGRPTEQPSVLPTPPSNDGDSSPIAASN